MTTFVLGVVGVYRKCRQCGEYFRVWTDRWRRRCWYCDTHNQRVGQKNASRAYAITAEGRAYLRELEAEERASA